MTFATNVLVAVTPLNEIVIEPRMVLPRECFGTRQTQAPCSGLPPSMKPAPTTRRRLPPIVAVQETEAPTSSLTGSPVSVRVLRCRSCRA